MAMDKWVNTEFDIVEDLREIRLTHKDDQHMLVLEGRRIRVVIQIIFFVIIH